MADQLPSLADNLNLPSSLLLPVAFGLSAYSALRMLAEAFGPVAKALGPLGRRWTALRTQRIAKAVDLAELTEQLAAARAELAEKQRDNAWLRKLRNDDAYTADLERQVRELAAIASRRADRIELLDHYVLADTEWHRHADIAWKTSAEARHVESVVPAHVPFLEFERRWRAARVKPDGQPS